MMGRPTRRATRRRRRAAIVGPRRGCGGAAEGRELARGGRGVGAAAGASTGEDRSDRDDEHQDERDGGARNHPPPEAGAPHRMGAAPGTGAPGIEAGVADAHGGRVADASGKGGAPSGRADGAREESRVDGGPDRIRTGDLQRDRLACWAATPRVRDRWRIIAGTPSRRRHRHPVATGASDLYSRRASRPVPSARSPASRAAPRPRPSSPRGVIDTRSRRNDIR